MLTDTEAKVAFEELSEILRKVGLDWVVTQVEEKIVLGKIQTKKLPSRESTDLFIAASELRAIRQSESKVSSLFTVAHEYTSQERLDILLDSLVLAVPTVHTVADQTFANLAEFGIQDGLQFEPEAPVRETFRLDRGAIRDKARHMLVLQRLINELRNGGTGADTTDAAR